MVLKCSLFYFIFFGGNLLIFKCVLHFHSLQIVILFFFWCCFFLCVIFFCSGRHALKKRLEEVHNDSHFSQGVSIEFGSFSPAFPLCSSLVLLAWLWTCWWSTWDYILAFQSSSRPKKGKLKGVIFSLCILNGYDSLLY